MKTLTIIMTMALLFSLTGCRKQTAVGDQTTTATATVPKDDSLAAKTGEAALRARKKAEALKAAEDEKTKQTNEVGNQ